MIKDSVEEMGRVVMALFLELPESIARDVKIKYDRLYNDIKDNLIEWHSVEEKINKTGWYIFEMKRGNLKPMLVWRLSGIELDNIKSWIRVDDLPKPPKGE